MTMLAPPLLPGARGFRVAPAASLLLATLLTLAGVAGAIRFAGREPSPQRVMVQVANEASGPARRDRVLALLADRPDVVEARPLSVGEVARLIDVDPADLAAARLPLPDLIEIRTSADHATLARSLSGLDGVQVIDAEASSARPAPSAGRLREAASALALLGVGLAALAAAAAALTEGARRGREILLLRDLGATPLQQADMLLRPLLGALGAGVVAGALLGGVTIRWLSPAIGGAIGLGGGLLLLAAIVAVVAVAGAGAGVATWLVLRREP